MTVSWFDGATLEVSVAFSKGAADTVVDADYTDISAYVRDTIGINRGRSSEWDAFQTGTLSLTLDNRDRRFDPDYSAGPYFGNLLPNRHIRVRLTYSGSTSYLFKGYVQGWPQSWEPSDNDSVVQISAHDWFKLAARAKLPDSAYVGEVLADSPLAWYRMGEQDGTAMLDSSGNNRHGQYANGAVFNTRTGLIANDDDNAIEFQWASKQYADTKFTLAGAGGSSWTIEFWFSTATPLDATYQTAIFGAQDSPASGHGSGTGTWFWISIPLIGGAAGKFFVSMGSPGATSSCQSTTTAVSATAALRHVVVCTRNGSAPKIYVNGVEETTAPTAVSGVSFANLPACFIAAIQNYASRYCNATIDEVAIYSGELSAPRILAHYQAGATAFAGDTITARIPRLMGYAGYSTFPTSLATSTQTLQGADLRNSPFLRDALQQMETTEGGQGRVYVAADGTLTFRDRYYDTANPTVATAFTDASGSTLPYYVADHEYDDTRVINDVTAQRTGGAVQYAADATSKTANGYMSLGLSGLQGASDAEVKDRAVATVAQYKDPRKRIRSLGVLPRKAPTTLFPTVRTTDISTRVSFRRLPVNLGSSWTQELTVEGVSHEITGRGQWTTSYLTAPADYAGQWLILDSATQGLLDTNRLGF